MILKMVISSLFFVALMFLFCTEKEETAEYAYLTFSPSDSVVIENAVDRFDSTIVTLTATAFPPTTADLIVPLTITGTADSTDYRIVTPQLFFPAGSDSATIKVVFYNSDRIDEAVEAVTFTMQVPVAYTAGPRVSHTIITKSLPKVTTLYSNREKTRKSGQFTFGVSLDRKSAEVITIPYKVRGTAKSLLQHDLTDGFFTFVPGDTLEEKLVTIVNDSLLTGTKNLVVDLTIPANAVKGEFVTDSITVLYDRVVRFQLSNTTISPWKQSSYESDLRVAEAEGLYAVINGGATEYVDLGYQCALVQKMVAPDSSKLLITSMQFATAAGVDSMIAIKKSKIDAADLVSLPGYTVAQVIGSTGIGSATYYTRSGTFYFEIVLSEFSATELASAAAKTVIDWLLAQAVM